MEPTKPEMSTTINFAVFIAILFILLIVIGSSTFDKEAKYVNDQLNLHQTIECIEESDESDESAIRVR